MFLLCLSAPTWALRPPATKDCPDILEEIKEHLQYRSPPQIRGGSDDTPEPYDRFEWIERRSRFLVMRGILHYANLGQLERDKDSVFVMLCEIARQFIDDTRDA